MKLLVVTIIFSIPAVVRGQAPLIQNVEPVNTSPHDTIVLTGSGFNNTPSNLDIWFGAVKGQVVSSSEFGAEVIVPPQARVSAVEIVNRVSQLSAKSNLLFMPSLKTEPFNVNSFAAPVRFNASEELWDLCSCDLNADGKPDLAATKFTSPSSSFANSTDIMILQNNSTPGVLTAGSFTKLDKTNFPVLNLTFGTDHIVCGDLQGDGYPELVVSRAGSTRNSIHIFRNTSIGTTLSLTLVTTPQLLLDVGHFATRMSLRDLNRDGKPEIIVTNSFNDVLYVFINQSSGGTLSFNPTPLKLSIKVGAGDVLTTYETSVQDLNGDNLPEIIINQFQTSDLYILRNQSTSAISFATAQKVTLPGGLNRLTAGDFDADGRLDLAVTSTLNNQLDIILNRTPALATTFAFSASISLVTSNGPWGLDVSDINGDGAPDIVVANRNQNTINVFLHNGNFTTPGFTKMDVSAPLPSRNIRVGDLDGDGKPDFAYTAFNNATSTTEVGILRNTACHKPFIQNPEPLVICNGQTIRLTTSPASDVVFSWTKDGAPVGGNNFYLNITAPGTYQVTAAGEGGACLVTSNSVVVAADAANAPADPSITANSPLCLGETLNLQTGTVAGATYSWTGPDNFTSSAEDPSIAVVTDNHAGVYNLQIKVGQCKSEVVSKRVDVARLADFTISSNNSTNTVCDGSSVSLTVNNQAGHTYQWRKDGVDIALQTSSTLTASQEGSYTVRIKNTALNCETETSSVTVRVFQPPVSDFTTNATGCANQDHQFNNQSTGDARAVMVTNWNFGDGFNATSANPTHKFATAQSFNVSLSTGYQGVAGCSNVKMKSVNIVNPVQPVIATTSSSTCPDVPVTLSIAGTFATITWSNAATSSSTEVLPGTYSVNTTDNNGCAGQNSVTITALAAPDIQASADPETITSGITAQLTATGGQDYSWTPAESLSDASIANPVASPVTTTTYTVTGRAANGCAGEAQVLLTVDETASFPPGFSPNGDGPNDTWNVRAENNPDCTMTVFDGRGRKVFEGKGVNWDGTYQGTGVPDGTYFYVFACPDKKPLTGSVLVFR